LVFSIPSTQKNSLSLHFREGGERAEEKTKIAKERKKKAAPALPPPPPPFLHREHLKEGFEGTRKRKKKKKETRQLLPFPPLPLTELSLKESVRGEGKKEEKKRKFPAFSPHEFFVREKGQT